MLPFSFMQRNRSRLDNDVDILMLTIIIIIIITCLYRVYSPSLEKVLLVSLLLKSVSQKLKPIPTVKS